MKAAELVLAHFTSTRDPAQKVSKSHWQSPDIKSHTNPVLLSSTVLEWRRATATLVIVLTQKENIAIIYSHFWNIA